MSKCCMTMRINVDCNGCCRKLRRILLRMKEIETHMIEKQQRRVSVCGRFQASDVAIKIRKKMKRRVEILDIENYEYEMNGHDHDHEDDGHMPQPTNMAYQKWPESSYTYQSVGCGDYFHFC